MKRLLIIAVSILLLFAAGCSSDKSTDGTISQQDETIQTTQDSSAEDETSDSVDIDDETIIPDANTAEANENTANTAETNENAVEAEEMVIKITVGERMITATLYDNEATRALWDMLPQTFPMMNLYGREMCYRMGNGALPDTTAQNIGYEVGDISYWPPAGSLVILYKQNGEVFEQVRIGHTDDDVSFFEGMEDTDITFEKAN